MMAVALRICGACRPALVALALAGPVLAFTASVSSCSCTEFKTTTNPSWTPSGLRRGLTRLSDLSAEQHPRNLLSRSLPVSPVVG